MAVGNGIHLEEGTLEVTPTWTVALVCTVFVLVSLFIERFIHRLGKWLKKHDQPALYNALEKMKEELMLLGFISLLLTVFQQVIASICMPRSFLEHMLPCKLSHEQLDELENTTSTTTEHNGRKLIYGMLSGGGILTRRQLSGASTNHCSAKGKVPFVSTEGLHQLHIFIFVLALVHVCYSCLTMFLGRWKIHAWHPWEREAHKTNFQPQTAMQKKLLKGHMKRQSTFVRTRANHGWLSSGFFAWITCFFRQFGRSVMKSDYLTLRQGFINNHRTAKSFDFHRYVLRVLEDDFKKVVGISGFLWTFVVIFLLLNINGWHTYFWISFIPLLLILIIGTKLEHIILTLGVEIAEKDAASDPVVNPRDELFWFHRPKLILYVMHFALFQNAFELAFFFWIWATFGFDSCFMENLAFVIIRLFVGVAVLFLCSYTTLPLYALVTQMGSHYKAAIFGEHVQTAVSGWAEKVKNKKRVSAQDRSSQGSLHTILAKAKSQTEPEKESGIHREGLEMSSHPGANDTEKASDTITDQNNGATQPTEQQGREIDPAEHK